MSMMMRPQVTKSWRHHMAPRCEPGVPGLATLGAARIIAAVCAVVLIAGGCSDDGNGDTTAADDDSQPVLYEGYASDVYADPAHWVCRPDTDDICDDGLDATVVEADGTLTEEP